MPGGGKNRENEMGNETSESLNPLFSRILEQIINEHFSRQRDKICQILHECVSQNWCYADSPLSVVGKLVQ